MATSIRAALEQGLSMSWWMETRVWYPQGQSRTYCALIGTNYCTGRLRIKLEYELVDGNKSLPGYLQGQRKACYCRHYE